jgi:tetraacyldisaccharide-1-P 4'-kinase
MTQLAGVFDAGGRPIVPCGQKVAAFAGIGNPESFLAALNALSFTVSAACWFDDHHVYEPEHDFAELSALTRERGLAAWITTLKDWVKLKSRTLDMPIWHVRIMARIAGPAESAFHQRLQDTVTRGAEASAGNQKP